MEQKLIKYIKAEFVTDPDINIEADTKLISSGIIDSFSLVSLQAFIAREFGKKIPAPRITAESFDTVRQMLAVISQF
jgi:acyl carrier protein